MNVVDIYYNLVFVIPETILAVMGCLILLFGVFFDKKSNYLYILSQVTLFCTLFGLYFVYSNYLLIGDVRAYSLGHAVVIDPISLFLKSLIVLFTIIIFVYSEKYLRIVGLYDSQYFSLCLFSTLGMFVLVSCGNFLSLYLGMELLALPIYGLVGMSRSYKYCTEAALKYFVMGSVSSAILLFGISFIYGGSGELGLKSISVLIYSGALDNDVLTHVGVVLLCVGIAFKFGAIPFHMWVPDVYKGAPIPVVLFISTTPKLAAFGLLFRILYTTFHGLLHEWAGLFVVMGILSVSFGNLVAIAQSNIKRMLAYSTIAHVGFVFLAIAHACQDRFVFSLFYILIYSFSSLSIFGFVLLLGNSRAECENLSDFSGLFKVNPLVSLFILITLLSLAGIPPLVGFYAKFLVLKGLVDLTFYYVMFAALLFSVIGSFYYLRVIKLMFFDSSLNFNFGIHSSMSRLGTYILYLNSLFLLFFGLYPYPVLSICKALLVSSSRIFIF